MDVSVVVPFRNTERYIARCLRSLREQRFDGNFEVIAVDDASSDRSAAIAHDHAEVQVLASHGSGPYAARNRGVAAAKGTIVAFTDSDCEASPDWLERIREAFSDDAETAVILGVRSPAEGSAILALLATYEHAKDEYIFSGRIGDIYYGATNNLSTRRETFDRFGPFVERRRGADTMFVSSVVESLGPRAVRYRPDIRVRHLEIENLRDYYAKLFVYGRSFGSFRRAAHVRHLTTRERLAIWRDARRDCRSSAQAAALLALLAGGGASWSAGHWSGLLTRVARNAV